MLRASCLTGRLSRRGQHILQEDTVSLRRVCHQHMSHGSHQPSVLQNGAAAHPLHDSSSGLQQHSRRIKALACFRCAGVMR